MAFHTVLWRKSRQAIQGLNPTPDPGDGGSVNYRLMRAGTKLIVEWTKAHRTNFLSLLSNMTRTGHLSLTGPYGVACEQGAPGMHGVYNRTMPAGVLIHAINHDDDEMIGECLNFLYNEVGLNRTYTYKGHVILPSPRVKSETRFKGEREIPPMPPIDAARDTFTLLAVGGKVKRPIGFWADDNNLDSIIMKALAAGAKLNLDAFSVDLLGVWDTSLAQNSEPPPLYLPIDRVELATGYEARIAKDSRSIAAMGKDGCHVVHCEEGEDGVWWRYDWEEGESKNRYPVRPIR